MTIVGIGLLSVAEGTLVWVAVILSGIIRDGFMAIFMTMVMETKGVGKTYSGTAMGMIMVYYRIGGLASPPLGNSLAGIDVGLPFLFWALVGLLALLGFYFVNEKDREAF
jgi:hypothetical protein